MIIDISLKSLLGSRPQRLFQHVCGVNIGTLRPREWQAVQLRPDLFGRLGNHEWLHAEVEAYPRPDLPWRMHGYLWLAWYHEGITSLHQIVFVLRGKARHIAPGLDLERPKLHYRYQVVAFEDIDYAVLAGGTPEESILSVLCKGGATPQRVRQVLYQCLQEPKHRRNELVHHLEVISGLRRPVNQILKKEIRTAMPLTIDLTKNVFWKDAKAEGIREGRKEGRAEGRAESARTMLRKFIAHKFGRVPKSADRRLAEATPQQLDRWSDRVFQVDSLDQLFK